MHWVLQESDRFHDLLLDNTTSKRPDVTERRSCSASVEHHFLLQSYECTRRQVTDITSRDVAKQKIEVQCKALRTWTSHQLRFCSLILTSCSPFVLSQMTDKAIHCSTAPNSKKLVFDACTLCARKQERCSKRCYEL